MLLQPNPWRDACEVMLKIPAAILAGVAAVAGALFGVPSVAGALAMVAVMIATGMFVLSLPALTGIGALIAVLVGGIGFGLLAAAVAVSLPIAISLGGVALAAGAPKLIGASSVVGAWIAEQAICVARDIKADLRNARDGFRSAIRSAAQAARAVPERLRDLRNRGTGQPAT